MKLRVVSKSVGSLMYAKDMLKSAKENLVVYGVESCRKIQQPVSTFCCTFSPDIAVLILFQVLNGFLVPSTFLPPLANDLDIDSTSAAFLVSIIGIANIASRIASGFLADLSCSDPLIMNGAALTLTAWPSK
nr:hypothetical protein BaRGS_013528 [Batillaria attramentaria]